MVAPSPRTGEGPSPEVNARAVSACANAYRDSRSDQKRRPRHHRGRSLRLSAVWGTILSRPLVSDAPPSDRISIFREVMASTKRLKLRQQSRQPGKPTALPCPPYERFSWTAVVGRRTGSEGRCLLHLRPHTPFRERGDVPVRPRKIIGRTTAFLRPHDFRMHVEH